MVVRDYVGERGVRSGYLLGMGLLSGMMKTFWNLTEVVVAQYWKYTKCHWTVHLKMVNFVLCEFHTKNYVLKRKQKIFLRGEKPGGFLIYQKLLDLTYNVKHAN